MSKIAEYNPLKAIKVPSLAGEIDPRGLIVLVGPNSSGKTHFLRDVAKAVMGTETSLVVCESVSLQRPKDGKIFAQDLLDQKLLRPGPDKGRAKLGQPHYGTGMRGPDVNLESIPGLCNSFVDGSTAGTKNEFLMSIGTILLTSLFLDRRLGLCTPQARFDQKGDTPQNDLQALFTDFKAQVRLEEETSRVFSKVVWLDSVTMQNQLLLRVSGTPEKLPYEDRLDIYKAEKYRPVDEEGDGLKSYVGVVIALLLGRRPVCLIDEPELCLHPPQAFALGRFIGEYGTGQPHVTFVATHSSHVLRGIIGTAKEVTILRLTNIDQRFRAHRLDDKELKAAIKRRTILTETVLDGIFSHAAAIVEAEGDRAVYQAAGEGIEQDFSREVHFVSVGGTGGINEVCKFYHSLRIPVGIVADLDVVTDENKMQSFLNEVAPGSEATAILELCKKVTAAVREIPPTITPQEVHQQLAEIKALPKSWANRDDVTVFSQLSMLRNRIDRLHELKKRGRAALDARMDIQQVLDEILRRCNAVGLFLVPCGQLENWAPQLMDGVSKEVKWAWADEAARRIQEAPNKKGDVWEFVRTITAYLLNKAKTKV